nr:MAG TPA: hypothetical protein [Bacteriophage sp.]
MQGWPKNRIDGLCARLSLKTRARPLYLVLASQMY